MPYFSLREKGVHRENSLEAACFLKENHTFSFKKQAASLKNPLSTSFERSEKQPVLECQSGTK